MTIGEVLEKYPDTVSIFKNYNLHCAGCSIAQTETLEQAAKSNNIDLKEFLRDLNQATEKAPPD